MRVIILTVFVLLTLVTGAQTNAYLADLAALRSVVEKTASFKAQINGSKLSSYNDLYNRLVSDTVNRPGSYGYFYNLAQLLFPLRDNHLGFYQVPEYKNFRTKESIDSFLTTREFLDYPTCGLDIDSLSIELAKKPIESIEGIYLYEKYYTVGVFKTGNKEYLGVILDSEVVLWKKGQVAIHLYEFAPKLYKAIYGHPKFKNYIFQPIEKYQNGSLVNSYFYGSYSQTVYSKQRNQADFVNLVIDSSKFSLRKIDEDFQYLRVQSFQTKSTTAQASLRFYDSIRTMLNARYLILDLRNNEGGAYKEMKKYLRLLKEFVEKGQLYVLVNNGTLSQAELFTLALKQLRNVVIVGQQTKGMLSYGSNYGKTQRLPSGRYEFYPTDMNSGSSVLQYEDVGITPDIVLRDDKDWIEQVVEIVRKG